jgi:hypothetical protein
MDPPLNENEASQRLTPRVKPCLTQGTSGDDLTQERVGLIGVP